ncbi:MAG: HAMP domain-containing sensor histidine kinase [Thermostichales cyanobacterium DRC_bins_46]
MAESLIPQEAFVADLVRSVSRELCNPLTSIKTAVKLLQMPHLKPTQRQHYLQVIAQECERQNRLIQSLLELTTLNEIEHQQLSPIVIADFIPAIVSTYQPLAQEKGVMLAYTVPVDLPLLWSVPLFLRKILVQLLDNALEATPQGGRIWVTVQAPNPQTLLMEVRDTGIGIPAADLPRIFERFYRVGRPKNGGIGMGLTLVQQLVRHLGGHIGVESQLGHGTTVRVQLPLQTELQQKNSLSRDP